MIIFILSVQFYVFPNGVLLNFNETEINFPIFISNNKMHFNFLIGIFLYFIFGHLQK